MPTLQLPGTAYSLSSYAIIRTLYLFLALWLIAKLNARQGIPSRISATAFALGVPAGILGARLLDALEYWGHYRSVGDLLGGPGSSIYGAFLVVFPVLWVYARVQHVSPLRFLDAGAPVMALGEAMTRIGCFATFGSVERDRARRCRNDSRFLDAMEPDFSHQLG